MAFQPAPIIPVDGVTRPQSGAVQFSITASGNIVILHSAATFVPSPTLNNVARQPDGYAIG